MTASNRGNPTVGPCCLAWALVAMDSHYAGDVLDGVLLGWGVGRLAQKGVRSSLQRKGE